MSWITAAGGLYEPTSRPAPRPQAANPTFTFGKQQRGSPAAAGAEGPGPASAPPACHDEPVKQLRWWKGPGRETATVSSMRNGDIESWWREARQDVQARVGELVNTSAARLNKQAALGSVVKKSLQDAEPPSFAAVAQSSYKAEFCGADKTQPVGRRGVTHSPQAQQAFLAAKEQAQQNKSVGRGTNLSLAQFS